MEFSTASASYFAILIGINTYQEKPLKGAVRDVQEMKQLLERIAGTIHIQTLIAPGGGFEPGDQDAVFPTYRNVISAFDRVTSLARSGDCVYIHFSGHGTRGHPDREFSNRSTGDLALVLTDESGNTRCLWGDIFALALKRMVDVGLAVTVVLDCCFAGSAYRRGNPNARYLSDNTQTGSEGPKQEIEGLLDGTRTSDEWRDASMRPNWLINPDGYAILAACGPQEEARELDHKGEKHGALSYLLLETLEKHGLTLSHGNLCDHLRARFLNLPIRQTPMLYGNREQPFFGGRNNQVGVRSAPVRKQKQDGTLILEAGCAHGICDGDQFLLCPLDSGATDTRSQPVRAVSVNTRALVTELKVLDGTETAIRTGWCAVPLTRLCLKTVSIQLCGKVDRRDELIAAVQKASLMIQEDPTAPCSLYLRSDGQSRYEILDGLLGGLEQIANLPAITPGETAVGEISAILEHLAMFKFVKDLYPKPDRCITDGTVDARLVDHRGNSFLPGDCVEVPHEEVVTLVVKNKGNKDLYLHVYDMGPHWQVSGLLKASYAVIPGPGRCQPFRSDWSQRIRMKVPTDMVQRGEHRCHDIIKVLITSGPTSFDLLELPKISGQRPHKSVSQSANCTSSRTGSSGDARSSEEWAAFNFPICTVLPDTR
ncbi:caspase domain-containing protein [Aspergillus granulosus]|uniref:Caspase domain-containing protein n=1 Tax=Aspergillus granulosus TaxID=176169 RepID=A0ABR4HX48_9EURO